MRNLFTPRARKLIIFILACFIIGSILISQISTPDPDDAREEKEDNNLILHLFEIGGVAVFIGAVIHALRHWEKREVMIFFLSCFLYALLFEDLNIQMSGDYSYNKEAWMMVHNTMLVIVLGWCAIVYCIVQTIESNPEARKWNPLEKGLVAAILALTIDIGIDATAFAYGLWYWKEGYFFGVPVVNFVGWFGAVFWFVFGTEILRKRGQGQRWGQGKEMAVRVGAIFPEYIGLLLFVGLSLGFLQALGIL